MEWLKQIGKFVLLVALQWLLFDHLLIANWCFPMVYIVFLLGLPANIKPWIEVLIACAVGCVMDIIYSSPGVHMAACTAIGFLRPILLHNMVQEVERVKVEVNSTTIGMGEYVKSVCILTLIHHSIVFGVEAWSLNNWWMLLLQILISSLMTIAMLLTYDHLKQ